MILIPPINGTAFSSSLHAAINPINQQTTMKIDQIHQMNGTTLSSENRKMTNAWFKWNFAPSLSPAQNAIINPIQLRYATIPVTFLSISRSPFLKIV